MSVDIVLGTLVKVLGLRGELRLRPGADFWPAALASAHLCLEHGGERRPVRVAASRPHTAGTVALRLEGVTHRDAAERLVGGSLLLDSVGLAGLDVPPPPRLLDVQLCGMEVRLPGDAVLGRVAEVLHLPAHDVLVVRAGTREVLVPAVPPFVHTVDVEGGWVRIEPIPGLLEP